MRVQRLSDAGDYTEAPDLPDVALTGLPDNQQAIGLTFKCLNKLKQDDACFAFARALTDGGIELESRNLVEVGRVALRADNLVLARTCCDAALEAAPEGRQSLVFSGDLAM